MTYLKSYPITKSILHLARFKAEQSSGQARLRFCLQLCCSAQNPCRNFWRFHRLEILQLSRTTRTLATGGCAAFLRSLRELRCRILHCSLRFRLQLCCSARNLYRNCPALAGMQFFSCGSACSFAAARSRWQSHLPSQAALSHSFYFILLLRFKLLMLFLSFFFVS